MELEVAGTDEQAGGKAGCAAGMRLESQRRRNRRIYKAVGIISYLEFNVFENDSLTDMYRWEKDGRLSKAACWLVFIGQYGKAAELLMRSDGKNSIFQYL